MIRCLLIFTSFLLFIYAEAQNQSDSLKLQLKATPDSAKVRIYTTIAEKKIQADTSLAREYATKALALAQKMKSPAGQAKANYLLGELCYYSNTYPQAIRYYTQAFQQYQLAADTAQMIDAANSKGLSYFYLQQFEQAAETYITGLQLAEATGDKEQMAYLYSNISMVYIKMKNFQAALNSYREALAINKQLNRKESIAVNLNGIGITFFTMEQPDSARIYYQQALKLFRQTGNQTRIATLLNNIANIYVNQKDSLDKALRYYKEAEKIFNDLHHSQNVVHVIEGIGSVYRQMKLYDKALQTYYRGIEQIQQQTPDFELLQLYYKDLALTYEIIGKYKEALQAERMTQQYADSVWNVEQMTHIAQLEAQFETQKKEVEIGRLKAEQQLSLERQRRDRYQKILALVSLCLLLVILFYLSYQYAVKKRHNELLHLKNQQIQASEKQLQQLNAAKNKFFSIIAHDLKSPFHTVMGYSQLLSKEYKTFSDDDRIKFANNIYKSTNTIFRLLSNLLEWSRSQTNRLSFNPTEIEFSLIYDNVINLLKPNADEKKISIHADFENRQIIFADPVMLETVIRNLVNNAIKYTAEGGEITISLQQYAEKIRITVQDNGIGISQENIDRLFQIESKVKERGTFNEDGSGIGLILCKELIDRHSGKIWAESNLKKGSLFIIELPLPSSSAVPENLS